MGQLSFTIKKRSSDQKVTIFNEAVYNSFDKLSYTKIQLKYWYDAPTASSSWGHQEYNVSKQDAIRFIDEFIHSYVDTVYGAPVVISKLLVLLDV